MSLPESRICFLCWEGSEGGDSGPLSLGQARKRQGERNSVSQPGCIAPDCDNGLQVLPDTAHKLAEHRHPTAQRPRSPPPMGEETKALKGKAMAPGSCG